MTCVDFCRRERNFLPPSLCVHDTHKEMANTVRLTWAVPVSAHLIGARLEAYVESKAIITTFRLCAQYGSTFSAPVARIPAELINKIAKYIDQSFFEKRLPQWANVTRNMGGQWYLDCEKHRDIYLNLDMISGASRDTAKGKRFVKCREVELLDSTSMTGLAC